MLVLDSADNSSNGVSIQHVVADDDEIQELPQTTSNPSSFDTSPLNCAAINFQPTSLMPLTTFSRNFHLPSSETASAYDSSNFLLFLIL